MGISFRLYKSKLKHEFFAGEIMIEVVVSDEVIWLNIKMQQKVSLIQLR